MSDQNEETSQEEKAKLKKENSDLEKENGQLKARVSTLEKNLKSSDEEVELQVKERERLESELSRLSTAIVGNFVNLDGKVFGIARRFDDMNEALEEIRKRNVSPESVLLELGPCRSAG